MTILNILQIIIGLLILFIVTMQVKKDASGLAGLMGNTTSKNKNSNIDKSTKYMLFTIILFMFLSFGVSYQKSGEYKSIVSEKSMQQIQSKKDIEGN